MSYNRLGKISFSSVSPCAGSKFIAPFTLRCVCTLVPDIFNRSRPLPFRSRFRIASPEPIRFFITFTRNRYIECRAADVFIPPDFCCLQVSRLRDSNLTTLLVVTYFLQTSICQRHAHCAKPRILSSQPVELEGPDSVTIMSRQ